MTLVHSRVGEDSHSFASALRSRRKVLDRATPTAELRELGTLDARTGQRHYPSDGIDLPATRYARFQRNDRRLLGVHIVGEVAAELIGIGQATIHAGGKIDLVNALTFATPTYTVEYKYAAYDGIERLLGQTGGPLTLESLLKAESGK